MGGEFAGRGFLPPWPCPWFAEGRLCQGGRLCGGEFVRGGDFVSTGGREGGKFVSGRVDWHPAVGRRLGTYGTATVQPTLRCTFCKMRTKFNNFLQKSYADRSIVAQYNPLLVLIKNILHL